jgi:hypothetical protein
LNADRAAGRLDPDAGTPVGLLPEPETDHLTSDVAGPGTEVTVLAHSRFGEAAALRLQLIALIYERLTSAGIGLRES